MISCLVFSVACGISFGRFPPRISLAGLTYAPESVSTLGDTTDIDLEVLHRPTSPCFADLRSAAAAPAGPPVVPLQPLLCTGTEVHAELSIALRIASRFTQPHLLSRFTAF